MCHGIVNRLSFHASFCADAVKFCTSGLGDSLEMAPAISADGHFTINFKLRMAPETSVHPASSLATDAATEPIIVASKLGKTYRSGKVEATALRSVSFSAARGEFISIVGPSGSGKSTLFYILGGLTHATTGSVLIDGVDFARLTDIERTRMRRAKIGFVFQRFNLLPTLSALDNIQIAYDISNLGGPKKPIDRGLLDHLTDILGIGGRLHHRPNELSGGEQQRVAIARALIARPAIVLADEPTGNLDTENSDAVLEVLHRSSRELKQTVLMITHNPEAAQIADRILHLRDGQVTHIDKGQGSVVHEG
jgi:putative ABC transport system ATP-binding protein